MLGRRAIDKRLCYTVCRVKYVYRADDGRSFNMKVCDGTHILTVPMKNGLFARVGDIIKLRFYIVEKELDAITYMTAEPKSLRVLHRARDKWNENDAAWAAEVSKHRQVCRDYYMKRCFDPTYAIPYFETPYDIIPFNDRGQELVTMRSSAERLYTNTYLDYCGFDLTDRLIRVCHVDPDDGQLHVTDSVVKRKYNKSTNEVVGIKYEVVQKTIMKVKDAQQEVEAHVARATTFSNLISLLQKYNRGFTLASANPGVSMINALVNAVLRQNNVLLSKERAKEKRKKIWEEAAHQRARYRKKIAMLEDQLKSVKRELKKQKKQQKEQKKQPQQQEQKIATTRPSVVIEDESDDPEVPNKSMTHMPPKQSAATTTHATNTTTTNPTTRLTKRPSLYARKKPAVPINPAPTSAPPTTMAPARPQQTQQTLPQSSTSTIPRPATKRDSTHLSTQTVGGGDGADDLNGDDKATIKKQKPNNQLDIRNFFNLKITK